mmetsp:Transcript_12322/g.26605  ORF Transcript_12322/g.26605 Transcript_12322/m.26605 type:complete len:579 (-) Transcript_12322:970-2706(-)
MTELGSHAPSASVSSRVCLLGCIFRRKAALEYAQPFELHELKYISAAPPPIPPEASTPKESILATRSLMLSSSYQASSNAPGNDADKTNAQQLPMSVMDPPDSGPMQTHGTRSIAIQDTGLGIQHHSASPSTSIRPAADCLSTRGRCTSTAGSTSEADFVSCSSSTELAAMLVGLCPDGTTASTHHTQHTHPANHVHHVHVTPAGPSHGEGPLVSAPHPQEAVSHASAGVAAHPTASPLSGKPLVHATAVGLDDTSLPDLVEQVCSAYHSQYTATAYKLLRAHCEQHGSSPEALQPHFEGRGVRLQHLMRTGEALLAAAQKADHDEGWQVVSSDAFKMMYKHVPGSVVHSFKARCTMDAPLEQPLCLCREFDLCPSWNKYMLEGSVLRELSVVDVMVRGVMWVPWPLNPIEFVAAASGADLLQEDGSIIVALESPEKLPDDIVLPAASAKRRQFRFMHGSYMQLRPLQPAKEGGPPRTTICFEIHVDPGFKYVPASILTFVLRVMAPFIYSSVLRLLQRTFKDPQAELPRRIGQRTELYGLVRERVAAYLSTLPASPPPPEVKSMGSSTLRSSLKSKT